MKNRKFVIIITLIILVIVAALVYVLTRPKAATESSNTSPVGQTSAPTSNSGTGNDTPVSSPAPGAYIDYSDANFANHKDTRRVLFFHASWCPQCQALEESIETGDIPAGMVIFKVNYDKATDLKQKYGVTLQTTMVEVDAKGNLRKKFVAYDDPSLPTVLKALGN